ncbi:hypothetical protein SARC_09953 [Sphaeroforma arctica JP610]|uniref:Deoxyhypusine hydroxylase n=1 Tax=Sphaeroforma arctica JP610 TaxID=667725 RepID=A0A0L0FM92_9EUKA|nr:hypothetical protein SARC_09953 [Sphaeroforma arctica JP610]KNC77586.1 hypothetical protein SARC_09953 [Sphaeroforma arctica JP610]|eukprot:XP_014151488.1 hypothetical protein SARC_09953 [Sphaeroforma arctica JP610]
MVKMKLDEQIPALGAQLLDTNLPLSTRYRVLFTLKGIGGDEAVKAISAVFEDESELLKHESAYVLGQMQNMLAVDTLKAILRDQNQAPVVRHESGEALAALGRFDLVDILDEFAKDECVDVAETCEIGAKRLRHFHDPANLFTKALPSVYSSVDPTPACDDAPVDELVARMMNYELDLFDRYTALFALRNKGSDDSILAICKGFADTTSVLFRHEIAYVLGQIQSSVSAPALTVVLENAAEHPMVRHEAAEALGSVASPDVLKTLEAFKKDDKRIVAESCVVALDMYEYENSGNFQYANGVETAQTVSA